MQPCIYASGHASMHAGIHASMRSGSTAATCVDAGVSVQQKHVDDSTSMHHMHVYGSTYLSDAERIEATQALTQWIVSSNGSAEALRAVACLVECSTVLCDVNTCVDTCVDTCVNACMDTHVHAYTHVRECGEDSAYMHTQGSSSSICMLADLSTVLAEVCMHTCMRLLSSPPEDPPNEAPVAGKTSPLIPHIYSQYLLNTHGGMYDNMYDNMYEGRGTPMHVGIPMEPVCGVVKGWGGVRDRDAVLHCDGDVEVLMAALNMLMPTLKFNLNSKGNLNFNNSTHAYIHELKDLLAHVCEHMHTYEDIHTPIHLTTPRHTDLGGSYKHGGLSCVCTKARLLAQQSRCAMHTLEQLLQSP